MTRYSPSIDPFYGQLSSLFMERPESPSGLSIRYTRSLTEVDVVRWVDQLLVARGLSASSQLPLLPEAGLFSPRTPPVLPLLTSLEALELPTPTTQASVAPVPTALFSSVPELALTSSVPSELADS